MRLLGIWLALACAVALGQAAPADTKMIAVTIDDLPLGGPQFDVTRQRVMTEQLLASLQRHNIESVGFVNETKLFVLGEVDERITLLQLWLAAGQELDNHTFSHPSAAVMARFRNR